MTEADVRRLVDAPTPRGVIGFFGEPRVNVLELNLALDREHRSHGKPATLGAH